MRGCTGGERLPPIGLVTLGLALAVTLAASARTVALALRTRALTAWCGSTAPPMSLRTVAARLGIAERLTLFGFPVALAFTAGLAQPRIYVSTAKLDALSAEEPEAVLLHERAHLLRRDPLRMAIARLISSVLFFIPLAAALLPAAVWELSGGPVMSSVHVCPLPLEGPLL